VFQPRILIGQRRGFFSWRISGFLFILQAFAQKSVTLFDGRFQGSQERLTQSAKNLETMKTNLINSAFAGITILLITACASMTTAPSAPPSATVSIREWSAAYYGSAAAGNGTLYYNGRGHHFTISGLGAGGLGAQKISATGKVYNLNNLSDFSGTYRGVSNGLTLIEGKLHAKLTNGNGVVLYLAGETEGLASSLGVQAFEVTLAH
jgi:hypothetical protein